MTTSLRAHIARAAALVTLTTAACDDPALVADDADDIAFRDGGGQSGPKLNTNVIDTSSVSQVDTRGVAIDGVSLREVRVLQGGVYNLVDSGSLFVQDGVVKGRVGGQPVWATHFVGSKWLFRVDGLTPAIEATLMEIQTSLEAGLYDPNHPEVLKKLDPARLVYTFKFGENTISEIATCAEDSVAGARMVLYGDILVDHDTGAISERGDTIYFGCFSGAVGKAALWGYAPDSPSLPSVDLTAFETAVRTVRADYCADGESHTKEGNMVTLLDEWGINDHEGLNFHTEAVWEAGGGALCLNHVRDDAAELDEAFVCPGGQTIPFCPKEEEEIVALVGAGASFWTKIP